MAKDVSKEDDDDKFEKMDEDSLNFLEQVRKGRARYFVLSMKGNKVRSLVVKKKPIKDKELKSARGEGFQPVFGVATGSGANITFSVARSDGFDEKAAACKTEKLKKFLTEQTGKAFKPSFELVATPPAVPFDDADLNDPLIARFMKMEPVINKACDAHPANIPVIQGTVERIRGLLQDDETRTQAAPQIDEFVHYLKNLLAKAAVPPAPPLPDTAGTSTGSAPSATAPSSPEGQHSRSEKLAEAIRKLKPLLDKVVVLHPQRKGELTTSMAQVIGEIKAGQLDAASNNIVGLGKLLQSLAATPSVGGPNADLRGEAEAMKTASREDGSNAFVTMQKSRLLWETTLKRVHGQLDTAVTNIIGRCSELNDDEESEVSFDLSDVETKAQAIHKKFAKLDRRLIDALDDGLNATDDDARAAARKRARSLVDEYSEFVASDPFLAVLDVSGFASGKLRETLNAVLNNLATNL